MPSHALCQKGTHTDNNAHVLYHTTGVGGRKKTLSAWKDTKENKIETMDNKHEGNRKETVEKVQGGDSGLKGHKSPTEDWLHHLRK